MVKRFWTIYLTLVLLRLYVALSKSYIHPDEMFQGSEVIVGDIYKWPTFKTWEFTSSHPIRSIIPIYLFQSPLLYHLYMFSARDSSTSILYTLRVQQFLSTLIIDGLLFAITRNQIAMLLFASSYTTLAYHTHTFSNSWETIFVLGTLSAAQGFDTSLLMGPLACLGLFTRITFAAFMMPLAFIRAKAMLVRDTHQKKWSPDEDQIQMNAFALLTFSIQSLVFIYLDTLYYTGVWLSLLTWDQGIFTLWNNLVYNFDPDNLAEHGIHARYTHVINFVVLLGPGVMLLPKLQKNIFSASMLTGFLALLSAPHQEARFLLPCVGLFFAAVRPKKVSRSFWIIWLMYNTIMTVFMGVFHQCGVVPTALHIAKEYPHASITWHKSYPAPKFLLGPGVNVTHIYGVMEERPSTELFVTPLSNPRRYDDYELVYKENWHINLDDLDVLGMKVFTERGMGLYKRRVTR